MKKNDDSVITPVLWLETIELGGFTEITNMWRGPGTHVIITKKNIQFEIFQIQFLPIKLHWFHGVQIWVLYGLMLLNSRFGVSECYTESKAPAGGPW